MPCTYPIHADGAYCSPYAVDDDYALTKLNLTPSISLYVIQWFLIYRAMSFLFLNLNSYLFDPVGVPHLFPTAPQS